MNLITRPIYKPERKLFYIIPSEQEIKDYYKGIIPSIFDQYTGTFGTYCFPSLFRVKDATHDLLVIGIEYRPNDERISYPSDMPSVRLRPCFMVSALFATSSDVTEKTIDDNIEYIKENVVTHSFHNVIRPLENPEVIQLSFINNNVHIYIQANDITKEAFFGDNTPHTIREKKFYFAAYHDFITGHYNWSHIWPIIAGYGLVGIQDYSFVHFDVKDFNALNVVYGHEVANKVLIRIVQHMNETDWIYSSARCDNDNFSMIIRDMPQEETHQKLMQFFKEISGLEEDPTYRIYYRCGVVPMRNTLLLGDRVADAGKQVQRMGSKAYGTEVMFYTDKMHDDLDWSAKVKAYLESAIEKDEFLVYLQPKIDLATNKVHGAEALIRWMYQGRELLKPGRFVPILETGGVISRLDDIVLRKVCAALKNWEKEGKPLYPISVNLSRKSLVIPHLAETLTEIVDSYQVDHSLIEFELTESAAYENQDIMLKVINRLKEHGFRISMDDFGTGYSSLSLLPVMPMDTIKIDKSFVDGIGKAAASSKDCAVIKHIISMTKELNCTCLAEGAETKEQVEALKDFGCEVIQGYYYSRPIPVEDYENQFLNPKGAVI